MREGEGRGLDKRLDETELTTVMDILTRNEQKPDLPNKAKKVPKTRRECVDTVRTNDSK